MAKVDQEDAKKVEPGKESEHSSTIKSQILDKTGRPPRLHHVEVCQHHNGNYRVNVWENREAKSESVFSSGIHIAASYYLKVSDAGEIINSNPPLTQREFTS